MGKEEDKIEKLIRGLLKLPDNRRCINCNSLGPQYVCTSFWTFICTNCSGVHREFTHRVKSVSMAKFSMEEVNSLQAGGNQKAREIYFKTWNSQRNFFPDNSNIQKLREFIKHVYVDRRYSGDNHHVLLPRLRNSDRDESYECARQESHRERATDRHSKYGNDDVRSPGYPRESSDKHSRYSKNEVRSPGYPRETNERHGRYISDEVRSPGYPRETNERHGRYISDEVRSPGYSRENSRYGGLRASSSRFEGTDHSYQVDDARIAGRSATQMFTTADIKPRRKSPDRHRGRDVNSPTSVRNARELLGEKFVSLRVGDQPKRSVNAATMTTNAPIGDNSGQNSPQLKGDQSKTAHRRTVSANVQNTVRQSNQIPASNDALKPKSGSEGSLVDFASFPSPPPSDAANQSQAIQIQNPSDRTTSTTSNPPVKENVRNAPPKNTLEFLLFELSTPAENTPTDRSLAPTIPNHTNEHLQGSNTGPSEPSNPRLALTSAQESPNTPSPSTANRFDSVPQMVPDFFGDNDVSSFDETRKQQENSSAIVLHNDYVAPQTSHLQENAIYQATNLCPAPSAEVAFNNFTAQPSKPSGNPTQETNSAIVIRPPADAKSNGRAELPEDLFASLYQPRPISTPAWQMSPSYGMGYNMQYYHNTPMQTQPFSNVAKSVNPFDTNDDAPPHQFTTISSTPVQEGLPSMSAPSSMMRTQSFESHLHGFPPAQSPSYQSGAYLGQYSFSNLTPSSIHEMRSFGASGVTPESLHSNQQVPYLYSAPADPSSFPTGGGNPFG